MELFFKSFTFLGGRFRYLDIAIYSPEYSNEIHIFLIIKQLMLLYIPLHLECIEDIGQSYLVLYSRYNRILDTVYKISDGGNCKWYLDGHKTRNTRVYKRHKVFVFIFILFKI